jgi:hypothetical protein
VPDVQLTPRERAVLFALMAEARELTNRELYDVARVRLDGASRRRLNELKLVESRKEKGNLLVHELSEPGWAWCRAELAADLPPGARSGDGALRTVLVGLSRYLERADLPLQSVFLPDTEAQVRSAYALLARPAGSWVGLVALREKLAGARRADVDAALERLASQPGVHVQAEANQQALTDEDREAAVRFGGSARHLLKIESA